MSTMATQVPGGTSTRQTCPGEHAGENWRSSGWGVGGVLSRGWRSRASRPGSQQAAPAGGKPRSRRHHTVRRRTGPAHRRLLGRSIRAVATPTSSKPRPTSDTRDAKNDNEGGWVDHVRLDQTGTEDRPASAGLYELRESHNPVVKSGHKRGSHNRKLIMKPSVIQA